MRTIKKNVYYCDFCKKKGLSAGHIAKHEKHCTANPNRECRLCGNTKGYGKQIKKLKSRYKVIETKDVEFPGFISVKVEWIGEKITLDEIRIIADGCPNCMLSIMRLAGLSEGWHDFDFDYKGALKSHWADVNQREYERDQRSYY